MTRFKRIVSMFLVVIMVMSLLPLSVIAEGIQSTHTVSFKLTYNGAPKISIQKVTDGELATEPEVSRTGYILEYWYTKTENGNEKFDFLQPVTEDLVLYAHWKQDIKYWAPIWNRNLMQGIQDEEDSVTYTVTFDANGSDVENLPAAQTVKAGECAVEPAAPTKLIHDFGGWYTDSECTDEFSFDTEITENITLYAKWDITIFGKEPDIEHIKYGTIPFEGDYISSYYADNQLIITTDDYVEKSYVESLIQPHNAKIVGQIPVIGHYQIEFDNSLSVTEFESLIISLLSKPHIDDVYINIILDYIDNNFSYYPNDYINDVVSGGYDSNDEFWKTNESITDHLLACNVPQAWWLVRKYNSSPSIRMGLIDSAVDGMHNDLNVIYGYFYKDKYNPWTVSATAPLASSNHGTHVAGIMGACVDNGDGISGVALNAELISVSRRINDNKENYNTHSIFAYKDYSKLIESKCKVINVSQGFDATNWQSAEAEAKKLEKVFLEYIDKGYPFIITNSAGNQGYDPDHYVQYNSGLSYITNTKVKDRIIIVGNAKLNWNYDNDGNLILSSAKRAYDSNYQGGGVDVMAPGTYIYSTYSGNRYGNFDGTSMAAPYVAGLAGLIWETNEYLTPEEVKQIIVSTADINVLDSAVDMVNAEAAIIKALGHDPRTKDIVYKFIDTSTNSPIKAQSVSWDCVGYTGYNPDIDYDDLSDMFVVLNGNEHTTIDTVSYEMPYGTFEFVFSASGYEDKTIKYTVDDDTNEIIVYMTPNEVTPPTPELPEEGEILRLKFIDADTKLPIQLSDIFHETAEISLGRSTPSTTDEEAPEITISVFESADPSDTEVVLRNVPPLELEEWQGVIQPRGNYQLYFDYTEVLYELPGRPEYPYTIGSYYLTENNLGEYVVTLELAKHFIKVENVTVTETNAADILGDGTAVYDYGTKTLTLTNAILCENGILPKVGAVESNIRGITLNIPEGTTSYLYSTEAQAIDSKGIHIIGKGTLHIGSDADYCAIGHSRFESRDVDIKDTTIIFEGASGGIHCSSFAVEQANISNTGIYGYDEFVSTNSISIKNSIIDITTIDSNILWSHGGDININNSDITLYCVNDELPYGYLLFAESASIYIDSTSTVNLVAPNVGTDEDHELLCATNGIFLENGLIIRNSAGKTCEVYQAGEGWNYSVRCTDGTYPNQIFISAPSTPIPAIKTITVPDRITITDVDYTWYIYVSGERGQFTLNGTFTLFGGNYYYPTVETTWGDTAEISYIKGREYQFSIDVWDTWDSSFDEGKTLGKIIISTGNKSKEITVVINGTFDVSFSY